MSLKNDSTLYMVLWRSAGVFKVGMTNRTDRIRGFEARGAEVLYLLPHSTKKQERAAQQHVGYAFPRAFNSPDDPEAVALLGAHAAGYTECYRVGRFTLGAIELAFLGWGRESGNR